MPQFTAITRRRVSVTLPSGSNLVSIGGVNIALPAEAGQGIDVSAADVGGDVWAVCIGAADHHDRVYLLKLSTGRAEEVSGEKARSSWIDEHGVVSWVPESDPYKLRILGTHVTLTSLDTKHPAWPVPGVTAQWGDVEVTDIQRSDDWEVASEAHDPNRRVVARYQGGDVLDVWRGTSPKPARVQAHNDGSCTVCVQIPEGREAPVFVPSSAFTRYVAVADELAPLTFPRATHRMSIAIVDRAGQPQLGGLKADGTRWPWTSDCVGVLCTVGADDEEAAYGMAADHQVPLYRYADNDRSLPLLNRRGVSTVQSYPNRGESDEDFEARIDDALTLAKKNNPVLSVYACFFLGTGTDGVRTVHQLRRGLVITAKLCIKHGVRSVWGFADERGDDDGVSNLPWLAEDVAAWQASVPNWRDVLSLDEFHELKSAPDVQEPAKPPVSPPVTPSHPPVTRSLFEVFLMAMSAPMTLLRSSLFIPSKTAPGRFLYPAPGKPGFFLSLQQDQKGNVTVSETQNDGGAEQFLWEKDRGLATVGDATNPVGGGYPVMNDGEPKK